MTDFNGLETDEIDAHNGTSTGLIYFVANYLDIDSPAIIETIQDSDLYNKCLTNELDNIQIIGGPIPYASVARQIAPNAPMISELDFLPVSSDPIRIVNSPRFVQHIPVGILVIGIIVIALTHGKIKK